MVAGRGGGPSLLRRGEKRLRLCHGQGAPGRIYEAYAWQPGAGKSRPVSPSWCCCCCRRCSCCCRCCCCGCCCCCRGRRFFLLLLLWLLLLLAEVGPIWAQVCPCLGPRLLLLWLWLSSCFFLLSSSSSSLLLLLLADVGPIWAQFCPCLGPRLAHLAHILA